MLGEFDDLLEDIENEIDGSDIRKNCSKCIRPVSVCLCAHIASPPIKTRARVLIIQHPNEIKRPLRTVPLLQAALDDCHVIRCRKVYNINRPDIAAIVDKRPAFVLFPGEGAIPCEDLPSDALIIAIDGTWKQARGMLGGSSGLAHLPKCQVRNIPKTEYVIRTQPEEGFVSTLEAISAALAATENNPELHKTLTGQNASF